MEARRVGEEAFCDELKARRGRFKALKVKKPIEASILGGLAQVAIAVEKNFEKHAVQQCFSLYLN
ncbi:hypothetical protein D3C85_1697990 [compost metagenome]